MLGKRGYILSPGDLIKGLLIGFVVGAIVTFLFMQGIIPNPLAKTLVMPK